MPAFRNDQQPQIRPGMTSSPVQICEGVCRFCTPPVTQSLTGKAKARRRVERATWLHFAALRWTARRTGLFRPFGRAPAARQTIVRVWHLPRLPLRPPTIALLVLLCLPGGTFFPSLRSRVKEKNAPQGRPRQKQWNIKATATTTATAHSPPAMAQPAASPPHRLPAVKTGSL